MIAHSDIDALINRRAATQLMHRLSASTKQQDVAGSLIELDESVYRPSLPGRIHDYRLMPVSMPINVVLFGQAK